MKFEIQERAMPPYLLACLIRGRGVRAEREQEGPRAGFTEWRAVGMRGASAPDCDRGGAAFIRAALRRGGGLLQSCFSLLPSFVPCGAAAGRVGPLGGGAAQSD